MREAWYVVDDNGDAADYYLNGPEKGHPVSEYDKAAALKTAERYNHREGSDVFTVTNKRPGNER